MQRVGKHLHDKAIEASADEREVFARSAYNRYYYACYLEVSKKLGEIDKRWSQSGTSVYDKPGHSEIPDIIKSKVEDLKKLAKKNSFASKSLSEAIKNGNDLADLMERARKIRESADYHPEIKLIITRSNDVKLNNVTLRDAKNWYNKLKIASHKFIKGWSQCNVR